MTMRVREMILLDQECYHQTHPLEFSDDSGWLGPPRAVPFAWELAPGTPKHDGASGKSSHSVSPSPGAKAPDSSPGGNESQGIQENNCTAIVKVESGRQSDILESGRHSFHILESAPRSFLVSRNSEVSVGLTLFNEGAVPFKWETEPGIPKDPDKCRRILDCPLTPPPVLHLKSMVVHSSSNRSSRIGHASFMERMKNLLWIHPYRPRHQDFSLRSSPPTKKTSKVLLLKDYSDSSSSPHTSRSPSLKKIGDSHSDDEDLSPVSVLDYNKSVRYVNEPGSNRLSSASSSVRSSYHTPKHSFTWDSTSVSSPTVSLKSVAGKEAWSKKNSLYSLITLKKFTSSNQGCFMMLTGGHRSRSSTTAHSLYEETTSEFNCSSEKSSSLSDSSSEHAIRPAADMPKQSKSSNTAEASDEDVQSVYYSPAPKLHCDSFSFHHDRNGFPKTSLDDPEGAAEFKGFDIIERVDSLDTIDPGFAPSEVEEDDSHQREFGILNRMASCTRWQKRQASSRSRRTASRLARNLFGRVGVCCYVPRDQDHHESCP